MINLRNAILEKNIENYVRCLVDTALVNRTFTFVPAPSVANQYRELFARWSFAEERNYITQLFALVPDDSSRSLTLEEIEGLSDSMAPDSAIVTRRYRLTLHHISPDADLPREVGGQVEFWMSKDQGNNWAIHRWIDNAAEGEPTWSMYKARFGQ